MKNFPLADSSDLLVVRLNLASWAKKTFDSYFLDMMYVEFKKNFPLVDSSELLVLDSIRPPEPKNVLFLPSRHDVRRVHKKFSSPDSNEQMAVRLILAQWPKNVWFVLSRHDVRRVHENISSRRFERADGC